MLQSEQTECQRCGQCCANIAYRLDINPEDIKRWIIESRYDILHYFLVCLNNGDWIAGNEMTLKDVEIMVGADMIDPNDEYSIPYPFSMLMRTKNSRVPSRNQSQLHVHSIDHGRWEHGVPNKNA